MATVLDLVKHYQHAIEKYPNDEHKILKCIDKLFNLDVTVQHLQETGVGRTVNALRKEPGDVGHAARALVYKWKLMVAAEESDQDGDHNNDTSGYNGHENGKDSDDNVKQVSKGRNDHHEKSSPVVKKEPEEVNGNYSGSKRKYHSSEEEEPDTKKSKSSGYNSHDDYKKKPIEQIKKEPSESEDESEDTDHSQSDDSDSEMSEYSEEDKHTKHETKQEPNDRHKSSSSYKHSSHKSSADSKRESSSSKSHDSEKHSKKHHLADTTDKHSSDKSKEKSHSSHKHKSSKEKDKSEKSSKSDKHSSEKDKKQKDDTKSSSSSTKHSSDSDKHKSSKTDNNVEKHSSKSEKHKSSSSSHSQKSDKEKHKSSSEKEISDEKHKSKHSSSSKEKHSSSSKERSKDRSSSSKEKTDSSTKDHHSHKSEKKHSSSSESKSKHSDSKHKSDKRDERSSETKSKHKSSSSSSHKSKSSSSKSKEEVPKKTNQANSSVDSDDGIDCGSGASFAEALGMISPAKPKKKPGPVKESPVNNDLSPASLLAPTAKLAPLPAIEISALPEISPNYKPRPPPKLLPHFTDEDAMSMTMSSKNQRTKVYSGNKVIGKIPTLYEMCVQVLQEHIDALEYTGGVPYDILKPVVDRATPQQLFVLEHYNPYLMDDTDHLWQKFCEKNFRNKQRQEMETWREMYMRCQEEQEHRLKSLTANIRIAQEAKKAPIKQTKMAYVDSVVKPPRNIARKQALHGTAHAASASPAARVASLAAAPNVLRGNTRPTPTAAGAASSFKPKKAPLMQKALQFMRGRKR